MRAEPGNIVYVDSPVVGRPPRRGRILEILGTAESPHYRVRWEDGHETFYYPGADGHSITGSMEADVATQGPPRVLHLSGSASAAMSMGSRVEAGSTLRQAAAVLAASSDGAAMVFDRGEPVGIVTDRDVVRALAGGADPDEIWVADAMPEEREWVSADDSLMDVADAMVRRHVGLLPLRRDGRPAGIISAQAVLNEVMGTRQL